MTRGVLPAIEATAAVPAIEATAAVPAIEATAAVPAIEATAAVPPISPVNQEFAGPSFHVAAFVRFEPGA